jgi:hypothetical protein
LSDLIQGIQGDLNAVRVFINACFVGEHSDLSRLDAFFSEFAVQRLFDQSALVNEYCQQLGIGPDADVLLREIGKLRDEVLDYGEKLVRLSDTAKGDAPAGTELLQLSAELADRSTLLNLELLAVEATFGKVKDLVAEVARESDSASRIGPAPDAVEAGQHEEDSVSADARRRPGKKADYGAVQAEAQLADAWVRARDAGAYKGDFAKQHGMKVPDLNAVLNRVRKRKSRADN